MLNLPGEIFLDTQEVEQALRYLTVDKGEGTVDELGFGPVYDKIADDLFPWCSTLTTRAYYFFSSIAIKQLASELTNNKFQKKILLEDRPSRTDIAEIRSHFNSNIRHLETLLALSLNLTSNKKGLFGIRNISRNTHEGWKVSRFLSNGILQLPTRYPNRIYNGSLKVLGAFSNPSMENENYLASSLKNNMSADWLIDAEWSQASECVVHDLERIYNFVFKSKVKGSSVKNLTYLEVQQKQKEMLKNIDFRGFKLNPLQKKLLKERITKVSPYVEDVEWAKVKKAKRISLATIVGALPAESPFRLKFEDAIDIDLITAPFRNVYSLAAKGQQQKALGRRIHPEYSFTQWKKVYTSIASSSSYSLAPVLKFLEGGISILMQNKGMVNASFINYLKARAEQIVDSRGKTAPHLREEHKNRHIIEDIGGVQESSFRLSNAMTILEDII